MHSIFSCKGSVEGETVIRILHYFADEAAYHVLLHYTSANERCSFSLASAWDAWASYLELKELIEAVITFTWFIICCKITNNYVPILVLLLLVFTYVKKDYYYSYKYEAWGGMNFLNHLFKKINNYIEIWILNYILDEK